MDAEAAKYIAKGIIAFTMVGTAMGEGFLAAAYMNAVARNPKLEESLFGKLIISLAIVESTAIYSLVAFFIT